MLNIEYTVIDNACIGSVHVVDFHLGEVVVLTHQVPGAFVFLHQKDLPFHNLPDALVGLQCVPYAPQLIEIFFVLLSLETQLKYNYGISKNSVETNGIATTTKTFTNAFDFVVGATYYFTR